MIVKDLVQRIPLICHNQDLENLLERKVRGGYASDLLSNVMGQAEADSVWVTMQGHQNIIAVAALANIAAVIVAGGTQPEAETIAKANREQILLFSTTEPTFSVIGKLYELGVGHESC